MYQNTLNQVCFPGNRLKTIQLKPVYTKYLPIPLKSFSISTFISENNNLGRSKISNLKTEVIRCKTHFNNRRQFSILAHGGVVMDYNVRESAIYTSVNNTKSNLEHELHPTRFYQVYQALSLIRNLGYYS